jgi:hypothetical protein
MKTRIRSALAGLACSAVLLVSALPVFAEDPAESRSAAFQAVEGPQAEQVPGGPLLVYAYATILVLLVAYVARLSSLNAKNRTELDRLASAIERGRKG